MDNSSHLSDLLFKTISELETIGKREKTDLDYVDFDALGSFIGILTVDFYKKEGVLYKHNLSPEDILTKIFIFLNSLLEDKSSYERDIGNILDVCIYELIVTLQYSYKMSERYMPKGLYNHFLSLYPKEENLYVYEVTRHYFKLEEIEDMIKKGISISEEWEKKSAIILEQLKANQNDSE